MSRRPGARGAVTRRVVRLSLVGGTLLWAGTVAAGMWIVLRYAHTPGVPGEAPSVWPTEIALARAAGTTTLVMLAHPRCPCTRASIGELERLMTRSRGRLVAHVLFYVPPDFDVAWARTDLWLRAEAIPGVHVRADPGGVVAQRLGATTSGQVVVYRRDGGLAFQGGITPSRGHEGDNVGSTRIRQIVDGQPLTALGASVYGCPLVGCRTGFEEPTCQR